MASLSDLPYELQKDIWNLAAQDAFQDDNPWTCMSMVCRDWYREICPLIWRELSIQDDGYDAATFIDILSPAHIYNLKELNIVFHWPFIRNDIDREQALHYLEATAHNTRQILKSIKSVEGGQEPHLKLSLQVVHGHPRSNHREVHSLWSDAAFRDSEGRLCKSMRILDGWAKSLPTLSVVTGLHFQPDFLPFAAMDGFVRCFPNLQDVGLKFLFSHGDEQCWRLAGEFLLRDLSPTSSKAPTVTITRFQDERAKEQENEPWTVPGDLPPPPETFMEALRGSAKGWKKFQMVDFGHMTPSPSLYTKLFSSPHQASGIMTKPWSQLREVHIEDGLYLGDLELPLTDNLFLDERKHDICRLFEVAGNAAAAMPVLEEMDICMHVGDDWKDVTTRLHYTCKLKEIWLGPGMPRSGFRAVLDISGTEPTDEEDSSMDTIRAATEVAWTSSIERARGLPLQITWHEEREVD